jgi:hypothetical protein
MGLAMIELREKWFFIKDEPKNLKEICEAIVALRLGWV